MLLPVIAEPDGSFAFVLFLVEGPHRLCSVSVDLDRSVVNLAHGLQLDIVTPFSILSLLLDVV